MLIDILLISFFGMLGVLARHSVNVLAGRIIPSPFPFSTLFINLLGSFLIGIAYVLGFEKPILSAELRIAITVGFLGGFTTFSTYCLDGVRMIEETHFLRALLYLCGSPILGVIFTFLGILLTRKYIGVSV